MGKRKRNKVSSMYTDKPEGSSKLKSLFKI
jgi:hypothetical protein